MSSLNSPIPLSEIESVLAWVDTYKLSRPTKKINRDFSDAVLLAEILATHYPKLVEMHNYPPRNSQALKLNNWMTLNRKVLRKLKLNLCINTMEQLANCAPGVIERVLVVVREKIRRDEDANRSLKEGEQNMSSGGSYYEACDADDNVLIVPVKKRVNGVLDTIQTKVVNYEAFVGLKQELKDAKDAMEILKQKVEHLDNMMKLKNERIDELQKQLERKQSRRKEMEATQSNNIIPLLDSLIPHSPKFSENIIKPIENKVIRIPSEKLVDERIKENEIIKLPLLKSTDSLKQQPLPSKIPTMKSAESIKVHNATETLATTTEPQIINKKSSTVLMSREEMKAKEKLSIFSIDVEPIKSDVFKEAEFIEEKNTEGFLDTEEYFEGPAQIRTDVRPHSILSTIEDVIQKEIVDISNPINSPENNYVQYLE